MKVSNRFKGFTNRGKKANFRQIWSHWSQLEICSFCAIKINSRCEGQSIWYCSFLHTFRYTFYALYILCIIHFRYTFSFTPFSFWLTQKEPKWLICQNCIMPKWLFYQNWPKWLKRSENSQCLNLKNTHLVRKGKYLCR